MYPNSQGAVSSYRAHGSKLAVENADPHKLIDMLLERAIGRLAAARGLMQRGNDSAKGEHISGVMAIITALQSSLDHERGGAISTELDALYDYMGRQLIKANISNDVRCVEEVSALLREIRTGWQGIKPPDMFNDPTQG
ncbi:MAG: flagellar export chaperone FliS [Gammaproteobacteria bacterium]